MEETSRTRRLRYVIIGVGAGILNGHRPALALPEIDLVAASDIAIERGSECARELNCEFYSDYKQMLAATKPDVAVILTPPYLHAPMTKDCLRAGCHVLVEKPIAIQVAEADEMIETAHQCQRLLCVVFQQRYRPEMIAARQFLQDGLIGNVQRVELSAVWTRPASYYAMASWRATWGGEGGGLLTNQASHNMDLLCYLLGSPSRVFAWTRCLLHPIETEDTVQAMLEWPGGALGAVHISTAEADDAERLKIVGTKGSLEISRGSLRIFEMAEDISEYARTNQNPYAQPVRTSRLLEFEPGKGDHLSVYRDFHEAIFSRDHEYSDGERARRELEVANAIIYSNYRHCEVTLPLDRQLYAALLADLQAQSQYKG